MVQGPTLTFNKTLDPAAIAAQQQADPTAARSEWDAEFRADLVGFLDDELIDAAVDRDRPLELPPRSNLYYRAYVDASGGAVGGDAYAIAIAHREDGRYVVDVVRGRSRSVRSGRVDQGIRRRSAGSTASRASPATSTRLEWVTSAWRNAGITYARSELTASELYLEALPLFTRALVALPDHPVLLRELRLLERSPARLKREQVTHPRGCHDDHANVCCGVLCGLASYLGAGAYADALARASDNVPAAELSWQEQERQRRYDELMQRYGQPISLSPPPPRVHARAHARGLRASAGRCAASGGTS